MRKELKETKKENEILEELFLLREMNLEEITEEEKEFVKSNKLNLITHDDLKDEIESLSNISKKTKNKILTDLDKLLEKRELINTYKCKKYYITGINDALNIVFNRYNEKKEEIL